MCAFNRLDNGELGVDGMPLSQIAADHDSPLYVYSGASIRDAYRDFAAVVAPVNGKVHFAMKANSALGILALLAREGAGADIVSGGELSRALAAGMPASDVVFSGVGKSRSEIEQALVANIGQINAESPAEVAVISAVAASMGVVAPVALRVNVDVDAKTHAKISTGQRDTKFGISTDQNEAANLYRVMADDPHIAPSGLAVHIGSQLRDMAPFETAYTALLALGSALRADGLDVPLLDLGGGVGVDYDHASPTDFTAYGAMVKRIFDKAGFKLGFEPGRSIVANSGILLTKVIFIKDGDNKRFIIVDAAMNDLLRPTLYEAHHTIIPVKAPGPDVGMADIVGPVCETGDYIGRDRMMPELASDDLLAVLSAGAYGAVMASAYNTRPPAGEVLVLDGQVHELRAKRSVESYLAEESIPVF